MDLGPGLYLPRDVAFSLSRVHPVPDAALQGCTLGPDTIAVKPVKWEWAEGSDKEWKLKLYESKEKQAPENLRHSCEAYLPTACPALSCFRCDQPIDSVAAIREFGTIMVNFEGVDFSVYNFETGTIRGGRRKTYHVKFDVVITVADEGNHLRVQTGIQGNWTGQTVFRVCEDWFKGFSDEGLELVA